MISLISFKDLQESSVGTSIIEIEKNQFKNQHHTMAWVYMQEVHPRYIL
jgi:hypothetical protein